MPERGNGKERNHEPVQIAPIPPYPTQSGNTPGADNGATPGSPRKGNKDIPSVQSIHDSEYVTVSTRQPARTKPFLPARREPERAPVEQVPVVLNHPANVEQPLPYSGSATQNQPETLTPVHQKELTPVKLSEPEKINGKLSNQPQNVNFPVNFLQPNFKSKLTKKLKFRGKKGRQRTNEQVVELLTFVQMKGAWPNEISDQMRRYYKREYPEYFRSRSSKRKIHNKGQVHTA